MYEEELTTITLVFSILNVDLKPLELPGVNTLITDLTDAGQTFNALNLATVCNDSTLVPLKDKNGNFFSKMAIYFLILVTRRFVRFFQDGLV